MSFVLLTDTILHGCALFAFQFDSLNTVSHALFAIPIVSIEIFLISSVALILFHRKYHAKLLLLVGFTPSLCLLGYTLALSVWNIQDFESWSASLNGIMQDLKGLLLLKLSLASYFVNATCSIIALLRSMLKYRRQINCYFGFHDVISANILTLGTIVYIIFILLISLHIGSYVNIHVFPDAISAHIVTIVSKTCFFLYCSYLLIRYHQRYFSIEPALDAIDDIDLQVEQQQENTCKPIQADEQMPDLNHKDLETQIQPTTSSELDSRMDLWAQDPNKYFLHDNINVLQVAEMIKVKPRLLSDYLNTVKGINFNQYINTLRIEEAKRMILEDKSRTFNDIAVYTGFSSAATFCKTFKRVTGITPTQYKQQNCSKK